jgi:hypothetical protein
MSPTGKPWERLSEDSARLIEQELEGMTAEILTAIARDIPAYTRPLKGAFGEAVRGGVDQALRQFAAIIRDPDTTLRQQGRRIYVALGRAELEAGRSIGALLAAYRLGAQIAWRRLAEASLASELDQRETNLLAEAIFAYIDEISAESAEGYAQAQAERAGEIDARRGRLIDLLTHGSLASDPAALAAAAEAAHWTLPGELAVLIWPAALGRTPAGRLPHDSIVRAGEEVHVALVPEPRDPARRSQLLAGFAQTRSGLGSAVATANTGSSYGHAWAMLRLAEASDAPGLLVADEHRAELIAGSDGLLAAEIMRERLGVLDGETPASCERLTGTLLAWLRHDGNVAAAAEELHVHEQTLRYRMARLRGLLGDALEDPEIRYELEFALRSRAS